MEFSAVIADLRRDPSLAPFLKPKAAVVVWSAADAHALWASPEAMPLVGALTAGGSTAEAEHYLRPLAERAPETGIRLERWRIVVGRRSELVTVACRSITTADNERAVLTAVIGSLPKSFGALDIPPQPVAVDTDGQQQAREPAAETAAQPANSAEPSPVAEPVEGPPESTAPHDQLARLRHLAATRRTMRFVWACDGAGLITRVSPELAEVVGPEAAAVVGRRWGELVGDIVRDPPGSIEKALGRQTTWPRCMVSWRVGQGEAFVPVELGAVLVPAGETADIYRGYGLCRLAEVEEEVSAPAAPPEEVAEAERRDPADSAAVPVTEAPQIAAEPHESPEQVPLETAEEFSETGPSDADETVPLQVRDHDHDQVEPAAVSLNEDEALAGAETAELEPDEAAEASETLPAENAIAPDVSIGLEEADQSEEPQADELNDEVAFVTAPPELDETDAPAEAIAAENDSIEDQPDDQPEPNDLASDEGGETAVDEALSEEASVREPEVQDAQLQDARLQESGIEDTEVQGTEVEDEELQDATVEPVAADDAVLEDGSAEGAVAEQPGRPEASAEEATTDEDITDEDIAEQVVAEEAAGEEAQAPQEMAPDPIEEQAETAAPEDAPDEAAEHGGMAQTETETDASAPAAESGPKPGEPEAETTPGAFAPVRGHVGATLGAPKVVPLRVVETTRTGEAEANRPGRPTLSPNERNAFREIARALGARYLGEEEPGGPPPKSREAEAAAPADAAPESPVPIAQPIESATRSEPDAAKARHAARQVTFTGDRPSFAPLTDKLPIGILVSRGDDILYANRTLLDFLGYPDVAGLAEVGLWNLFASRAQVGDGAAPIALKAANGADLAVDARLSTLEWNGAPATLLSFRRAHEPEIADRIRMLEEELVSHEARAQELSLILDTATDGVIVLDEGGRILSLNRSAEALFGYEESDVAGEFFTLLLAPESHVVAVDYLEGLKAGGVASVMNDGREVVGRVRQGGRSPLMITMGRISEPPHRKFCLVARDMTAFKRAEADLLKAKKAAEEASAQKSDFLAKISHEIRTPLNAIIGFAEVMQEERFGPVGNERYKEYLKDIHVSGGHVISLVNDLLDLAKIEAGRLELNFVSVNLNEVVASCVALLQPEAARGRIVLRTSLAPKLPPVVADERAMRQVVLNILSNAVKFTDAGGQVIVSSALTDRGEVALRVRDTGIGMTDTEIEQALEPFRQLATARRHGGTGLGLPLTKALVEANRGALSITSAKREGTLVEIVLPRTRVLAE
jgi:PAS domain S-box-containing protein